VLCCIHRNCSNEQSISSIISYHHSLYLTRLTNLLTTLTTLVTSLPAIVDEEIVCQQKSTMISGSFAERDLQPKASCASWPPCSLLSTIDKEMCC
jgi:hypothetical protein